MDARGEGDGVGVDGGAGDAIAALVERVASENEVTDRAARGNEAAGARRARDGRERRRRRR